MINDEIKKCLEYLEQIEKIKKQSNFLYENFKLLKKRENTSINLATNMKKNTTFIFENVKFIIKLLK